MQLNSSRLAVLEAVGNARNRQRSSGGPSRCEIARGSIAHRPVVVQRIVWWHPAHGVKGSIGTHPVCRGWHLGDPCDCTGSPIWFILLICAANHVRQARPLRSGRLQGAQLVSVQLCYGALCTVPFCTHHRYILRVSSACSPTKHTVHSVQVSHQRASPSSSSPLSSSLESCRLRCLSSSPSPQKSILLFLA